MTNAVNIDTIHDIYCIHMNAQISTNINITRGASLVSTKPMRQVAGSNPDFPESVFVFLPLYNTPSEQIYLSVVLLK